MYNDLEPLLPTHVEREDPDGATAWSDEVGLPGDLRLLPWMVLQGDTATFDINVLWDTLISTPRWTVPYLAAGHSSTPT